jgi:hypothetical protein
MAHRLRKTLFSVLFTLLNRNAWAGQVAGKNLETLALLPRHIRPPMKNTFVITALAAILGLALASAPVTVQAQTTPTQTPAATSTGSTTPSKPAKKKSAYTQIPKGSTISAISATSVTLKTAKGDLTLAINDKTGFAVDKKKSAASDFAAGDTVTGSYATNADGTFTAHNIRKKTAK